MFSGASHAFTFQHQIKRIITCANPVQRRFFTIKFLNLVKVAIVSDLKSEHGELHAESKTKT